MVSVAAIISVKFMGSTREIPKNGSKLMKNVVFCMEYFDAYKMLSFGKIGDK